MEGSRAVYRNFAGGGGGGDFGYGQKRGKKRWLSVLHPTHVRE